MTIEQRLEQVEQQNQRIQRTKKRLTIALTMMAVRICAVVSMAARGDKEGQRHYWWVIMVPMAKTPVHIESNEGFCNLELVYRRKLINNITH